MANKAHLTQGAIVEKRRKEGWGWKERERERREKSNNIV
jgi:hypothetical protein